MKKYSFLVILAMLAFACSPEKQAVEDDHHSEVVEATKSAFPADSVSPDGSMSFHGLRIAENDAISLGEMSEKVNTSGTLEKVKIAGTVEEVCQAKGCWMTMQLADDSDMRVRFKDYGFFVPKDIAGKTAIVEGKAFLDTVSVEDLRHYAVDGGMTEEEAAEKYTEPEVAINFEATGVIIKSAE